MDARGRSLRVSVSRLALAAVLAVAGGVAALQLARVDAVPAVTPADVEAARTILRGNPADGRAFRVLAQAAAARGDDAAAARLYDIAVRRAPRDRIARAVRADQAFARGDVDAALVDLDALMRVAPAVREDLLQKLAAMLSDARVRDALLQRLLLDPPWRGSLPAALRATTTAKQPALDLLSALAARTPLTSQEVDAQVSLLQQLGRAAEARRIWLASLPNAPGAAAGLIFDGGFEGEETSGGYGWRIAPPPGVTVGHDEVGAFEGSSALALEFERRAVSALGIEQWLALPTGRYRLQVAVQNTTDAPRPFVLEVACQAGGAPMLALELPPATPTPRWQRREAEFGIPASGCPGQILRLRYLGRSLQERLISGALRIDAVQLRAL